jgi:hypothetical protein
MARISVNIVFHKARIPLIAPALWPTIFPSCMSASGAQLVEPLSLVKAPSFPLHDLFKVSSIWMLVFFLYPDSEDLGCALFESIFFCSSFASLGPSP